MSTSLLLIGLARLLEQTEYGTYRQLLLAVAMLSPLFTLALPTSLLYFISQETIPIKRRALLGQTLFLLAVSGLAMGAVLFFCAGFISRYFSNPAVAGHLRVLALYPVLMLPSRGYSPALLAYGYPRLSGSLLALEGILKAGIIVAVVLLGGGLRAITWGLLASPVLVLVTGHAMTLRCVGSARGLHLDAASIARQIRYSLPLGLASIVIAWGLRIDQVLVSTYFGPDIFAIYAVGATEVPFVSLLQASVGTVTLPELTRLLASKQEDSAAQLWERVFDRSALVAFPAFLLILLVSEGLIVGLFSEAYRESVPIFRIYLSMMPLRVMTFGLLLRAAGKTSYDLWGSAASLIVNVCLGLLLLHFVGIWGPACSTVVALVVLIAYLVAKTRSHLHWTLGRILPVKVIAGDLLLAGLPFLVAWGLDRLLLGSLSVSLLPRAGIVASAYAALYLLFVRVVSKEKFRFLMSLLTFKWLFGDVLRAWRRE